MLEIVDSKWTNEAPDRLFHYTSLESLALILRNKTIRLNPLHKMDDMQEAMTKDASGLVRYVFASCWTDDATESIPMWNMYAGLESGVRIEMKIDPFRRYTYSMEQISAIVGIPVENMHIETEGGLNTFLPLEDMQNLMSPAFLTGKGILKKVEYVSDPCLLEPEIVSSEGNQSRIEIGELGRYKNKYWEFQREWRYVLNFCPFDIFADVNTAAVRLEKAIVGMIDCSTRPVLNHYDLHLEEAAMKEMKIMLSPKMSEGNKLLARALLKQSGLENCLVDSRLCGLI